MDFVIEVWDVWDGWDLPGVPVGAFGGPDVTVA